MGAAQGQIRKKYQLVPAQIEQGITRAFTSIILVAICATLPWYHSRFCLILPASDYFILAVKYEYIPNTLC